jgi:ATP-dependent Zn protease
LKDSSSFSNIFIYSSLNSLILRANADKLHIVAQLLLEKEKIDSEEFENIFV